MRSVPLFVPAALTSALLFLVVGCADKNAVKPPVEPKTVPTTTTTGAKKLGGEDQSYKPVSYTDDLKRACGLQVGYVDKAPKFDFEKADLTPADRDVLQQIAICITTGPLKGRVLSLVGRADPRGETEYNMGLGEHRADAVQRFLRKP